MKFVQVVLICLFALIGLSLAAEASEDKKEETVDEETLEYAKGSVCGYCTYCKFCKLCDADCPCETSASKPNCKMCKYCKFCYLCSAMCDTVCKPDPGPTCTEQSQRYSYCKPVLENGSYNHCSGGVIDTVSAAIVNALPSVNKDEVQEDLDSVKPWIDRKDEL